MNKTKINIIKIIIILSASVILGFFYNHLSGNGIPLIREEIKIDVVSELDISNSLNSGDYTKLKGIDLHTALKLFESDKALFIDARDQWDYSESHIRGAINIPEFSFDPNSERISDLDKEALYVLYCDGDDCDISKRLAVELAKLSFNNIYIYTGGFNEWEELGYPVERSEIE